MWVYGSDDAFFFSFRIHWTIRVFMCVFAFFLPHSKPVLNLMCYKLPLNTVSFTRIGLLLLLLFLFIFFFLFVVAIFCSSSTLSALIRRRWRGIIMLETMFCMQINHYPRHTTSTSKRSTSFKFIVSICFDYDETHVKRSLFNTQHTQFHQDMYWTAYITFYP